MIGLIGKGVTGTVLQQGIKFDKVFDTTNIHSLPEHRFDVLYCAAPGASRVQANQNPEQDRHNVETLIRLIGQTMFDKFVLIGTVDSVAKTTPYAVHRRMLEQALLEYPNATVLRLSSLIGKQITKNILYDLKHGLYINKINRHDVCQWYPLSMLVQDALTSQGIVNLVSEPVSNTEIIQRFFPQYWSQTQDQQTSTYDLQPYRYTKQQIFAAIENYCND